MPIEAPAGILEVENAKFRASSVEATNAVGIGTDSNDAYPLQVFKETAPSIRLSEGSTISSAARLYSNNSNLYIQTGADFTAGSSGDVAFQTMGGESTHMVIKNDGKVGIGVTDPARPLTIESTSYGGLRVKRTTSGGGSAMEFINGNEDIWTVGIGGNGVFGVYKDSIFGEQFLIDTSGNVGIGTTSPIAALDIDAGANDTTTPALSIRGGLYDPSDLYVLNTYNVNTGVGYAAKVIGVNIKNKVETDNTVQLRNNVGGITSAGAIYLGSDDVNQGIFGVLGGSGAAGTTLSEHLTVRAGGNVGIGVANPAVKLDVNGTIQTPLLNVNGTTMSKAPRVIHIDDTRSGCPPTWAANTPIMEYSLTLSRTAYVYVSVTTILNYTARADCYIYFNNSLQQSHLTASDNTSWNPVNITAGGSLGAGTHTIKFQCNVANVVGCQSSWGGMQILVFEQ